MECGNLTQALEWNSLNQTKNTAVIIRLNKKLAINVNFCVFYAKLPFVIGFF